MTWEEIVRVVTPASLVFGGLLVGIIFEFIVFRRLHKWAKASEWRWDDVIINALRRAPVLWFVCAGCFFALYSVPLEPDIRDLAEKILVTIVILSITWVLARIAADLANLISDSTRVAGASASLVSNVARVLVLMIGVFVILQNLGISITPLIGALGIGGLAAALALQDTLSNLFAGFQIIVSRQVRPGDYVQLDSGETGYVEDVKWRNTTIKDFTDNMIIVPNSKLSSAVVTNFNLPRTSQWAEVLVGVGYESDMDHVEEVCTKLAYDVYKDVIGEELTLPPKFHYLAFGESSIDCRIRIHVNRFGDRMGIQHNYMKRLHKLFKQEGINIPFPIRTVIMEKDE